MPAKRQTLIDRTRRALLLAVLLPATAGAQTTPPSPAGWLVDYGLAYGERTTRPQPHDAEYILIWMRAATTVDPQFAEAHLWRFDLLDRLGRQREAHSALADYCRSNPSDVRAALQLLERDLAAARTAEERLAICIERLERPHLTRELRSDINRRLGEIHHRQGDRARARKRFVKALALVDLNLPARQGLAIVEDRIEAPATQLQLALMELAASPGSFETRWRIANLLSRNALSHEALTWYALAETAYRAPQPTGTAPVSLLEDWAETLADIGKLKDAVSTCRQAASTAPDDLAVRMRLVEFARQAGDTDLAERESDALAAALRDREAGALQRRDAGYCQSAARFYLDVRDDPARALEFARHADNLAPNLPATKLLLGRALLENGDNETAITALAPLAAADPSAALAFARACRSTGRGADAVSALQAAAQQRYAGPRFRQIQAVLRELHAPPINPPDPGPIRAALAEFNADVLDFPINPENAIAWEVRLHQSAVRLTDPIRADLTLRNRADYPITIGAEWMIPPRIAIVARSLDAAGKARTAYLEPELNQRLVLAPGESTTQTVRLDTVATQALLYHQPQRPVEVEFRFMLNPCILDIDETKVMGLPLPADKNGTMLSYWWELPTPTHNVTRIPVDASPAGIERLSAQLRQGATDQRMAAIATLVALIFERQEAIADAPHTYPAAVVDTDRLTELIRSALRDGDPLVRARAATAFTYLPLDPDTINAAAPLLSDEHPLPRLLACELFAKKQGDVFRPVLTRLARDRDSLVADLARCYLKP
jgi:tetratricopeptide (TPR) repeat protein